MQNKIFAAILFGSLLFSSMVSAKITPIKQYKFGELNLQSNFRCEDTTGYYSSEPAGYQCSEKNIKGHKCYHNCTLVCNSRDYPYTQDNCVTDKNGTLGGESCAADGVNRYKTCSCSAEYTTCDSPKTHSEEKCTADEEIKYKNCVCPAEYQYTCTGANQSGSGQPCDGKYTSCNISCPSTYNKLCDGTGEVGVGNSCGGKFQNCTCTSGYQKTCTGTGVVGNSPACTADGINKYTSCKCNDNYHTCGVGLVGVGTACKAESEDKFTSCQQAPSTCAIGDIVCSDGNCYDSTTCPVTGTGVIGVIFDDIRKLAITPTQYSGKWYNEGMNAFCNNIVGNGQALNCYLHEYYTSDSTNDRASNSVRNTYLLYKEHPSYYLAVKNCALLDSSVYNSLSNPSNNSIQVAYTFHYGIPSITDWRAIKSNLYIINTRLNQIGGTQISTGTKYWTSTPYSANTQWHYTPSGNDGSFKISSLVTIPSTNCGSMYDDCTINPSRAVRCIYSVYGSSYNPINDYEQEIQLPEFP